MNDDERGRADGEVVVEADRAERRVVEAHVPFGAFDDVAANERDGGKRQGRRSAERVGGGNE